MIKFPIDFILFCIIKIERWIGRCRKIIKNKGEPHQKKMGSLT